MSMDSLATNELDDFDIFANDVLLRVNHLRVSFRDEQNKLVDAVKGISFDIPYNTTVALVGESGSGKSVSSLAIMGLLSTDNAVVAPSSEIEFEGRDLLRLSHAERRQMCGKDIAMIFQEPMTSLNPVFTVGYQIEEVLRLHMKMGRKHARARAIALLEEVGIPSPEHGLTRIRISFLGGSSNGS
jgi:peptide/nickel transport system ATP-binding protein